MRIKIGLLLIAITALILAIGAYFVIPKPEKSQIITELGSPFSLVNHKGEQVTEAIFKNRPHVIFFGFTHCPDICPTALSDLTAAFEQIKGEKPDAYFITVDPERDTVANLKLYLSSFDPRITGLTGSQSEIDKVIKGYKIYAKKTGETFDHTASLLLFDKTGRFVGTGAYKENLDSVIEKFKLLVKR